MMFSLAAAVGAGPEGPALVHYIPILTTLLSVAFLATLIVRASRKRWPPHLVWWGIGVFSYGLGTGMESTITLFGNSELNTRLWYWAGAILGGYPLATGSVYLLMRRRRAHLLTAISLTFVVIATVAVALTPIDPEQIAPHRPTGAAIEWTWVRLMTPFINTYAAIFLIGGAVYSSVRFFKAGDQPRRAVGTALIAIGALLPGIGGSMAKAGIVEALYIGEFVGLILIWIGYEFCIRAPKFSQARQPEAEPEAEAAAST